MRVQLFPTYWEDSNGAVLCSEHVGHYLGAVLKEEPNAAEVHTPIGVFYRMTEKEVADFTAFVVESVGAGSAVGSESFICESCRWG